MMARNFILLSGGPGLYDPQDPEHDQSWSNYVDSPLMQTRTREDQNRFKETDEEIWWFIYRPAYDRRWADEQSRPDRRDETRRIQSIDCGSQKCRSYVDLLEFRAQQRGWNLRWINSADDFWRRLNSFRDPISRLRYWGHARNNLWLSLDHNPAHQAVAPSAHEIIRVSDISGKSGLRSSFQTGNPSRRHIFNGCNTHTFASEWARVFNVYTRGYEGTLRFGTVSQTGRPTPAAGCFLRNYAPGGSAEAAHEVASAEEYLNRLEQVIKESTFRPASERDVLAEIIRTNGASFYSSAIDPDKLYRAIVFSRNGPLSETIDESFTVLARPGESPTVSPQTGDVLLRVALGEPGLGHVAVISDSTLWPHERLAKAPFRSESQQPGFYATVIEGGAFPHTHTDQFARRILNSEGRMPLGQLILRPRRSIMDLSADEDSISATRYPFTEANSDTEEWVETKEEKEFRFSLGSAPGPVVSAATDQRFDVTSANTRVRHGDTGFREDLAEQAQPTRFRTVFYDRESLRYLDGWTRATGPSAVFLIDHPSYDTIHADGVKRGREFDRFLAQALAAAGRGQMDLQPPVFVLDPTLATVPLNRASRGDWDDLMIAQLIGASRRLTIQSEIDQWTLINRLFAKAKADAREAAQRQRAALEFVAYFVLDLINATLAMVEATNVTMQDGHAVIPLGQVRGTDRRVLPGGDAAARVIGDIHTHYLLDPLIDLNRSSVGTTIRFTQTSLHSGVSDVDVLSARDDHLVVYAVDSRYLHRANPNGTKNDKLSRSGDVLREALRVFGGEPGQSSSG